MAHKTRCFLQEIAGRCTGRPQCILKQAGAQPGRVPSTREESGGEGYCLEEIIWELHSSVSQFTFSPNFWKPSTDWCFCGVWKLVWFLEFLRNSVMQYSSTAIAYKWPTTMPRASFGMCTRKKFLESGHPEFCSLFQKNCGQGMPTIGAFSTLIIHGLRI